MFCPKCGKINPDNAEKCSGCDAILHEKQEVVQASKKGGALKILVAAAIIVIAVVVVVLFLNGCSNMTLPEETVTF